MVPPAPAPRGGPGAEPGPRTRYLRAERGVGVRLATTTSTPGSRPSAPLVTTTWTARTVSPLWSCRSRRGWPRPVVAGLLVDHHESDAR